MYVIYQKRKKKKKRHHVVINDKIKNCKIMGLLLKNELNTYAA